MEMFYRFAKSRTVSLPKVIFSRVEEGLLERLVSDELLLDGGCCRTPGR